MCQFIQTYHVARSVSATVSLFVFPFRMNIIRSNSHVRQTSHPQYGNIWETETYLVLFIRTELILMHAQFHMDG